MNAIAQWITANRTKLETGPLETSDLDRLEDLVTPPRQQLLYLTAQSTNLRSGVVGWVLYDPTKDQEPKVPSDEPPYKSVLDAVTDGWHVLQFPISKMYEYKDLGNDYVGFDFILQKWI